MKTYKEVINESLKQAQAKFDSEIKKISVEGRRMSPEDWDKFYGILLKGEKTGLNLDSMDKMSRTMYNMWKKRQK